MFEKKYYPFGIKSRNHLIDLTITTSYRKYPSVYFQIHEMNNQHITVFWRIGLPYREFIDVAIEANQIINSEMPLPLEQITKTQEFSELMYQKSPIFHKILNASQMQIVRQTLNANIDKNIRLPGGRDGHSYEIMIYQPECETIRCWCILPPEWKHLVFFINFLVNIAELDIIYCAKTSK